MTGLLLQIGATKLVVSVVLAGAVWMVHRRVDRPAVSHPLWLMVLVALLVPAVVSLPVLPAEPVVSQPAPDAGAPGVVLTEATLDSSTGLTRGPVRQSHLAAIWLLGTGGLLGWTLVRTIRLRRALTRALRPATARLQRHAAEIGRKLGMVRIPKVHIVHARVTPMVWWTGGKVRVLIPAFLLTDLNSEELRSILAHELAHVRRRDHLVRWVEWMACSVFWWNPVAWWVRHQLQIAEESCCDQLALGAAGSCPRIYANALLRVVAIATQPPGFRTPLPASAAEGVGHTRALERRLRSIVSIDTRPPTPRWLRTVGLVALLCAVPLGLIYCVRRAPTESETTMNRAEVAALDRVDELLASADEATSVFSLGVVELQELIHHQEVLWKAVKPGGLSERDGREASGYLTNGMRRELTALFLLRSAERNRGLWPGDSSSRVSTEDLHSPELSGALADMRTLVEEIRQAPDSNTRSEKQSRRIQELNSRIYAAIGIEIEMCRLAGTSAHDAC